MSSRSSTSSNSSPKSSHTIEAMNPSPQVVNHPSGNPRLVVANSSSAPSDSKVVEALATMKSCFDIDSTLTAHRLVEVREHFHIPREYELHAPLPGQRPFDAFPNGFGLSTDALEAGLQFLLHPVIEACIDGWQISPSQMVPNSWRYLVAFLLECYGSSARGQHPPSPNCERPTSGVGKRQRVGGEEPPKKKSKVVMSKQSVSTVGGFMKARPDKGKGSTKAKEVPNRGNSLRELCEVDN
ncbi:hypothetical protein B296_00051293 [Ensete ventricosum]|uniref:Uncharacterized protein n=1 Tax=Ensete ventricosum TaxID=4639 RepID=A0A426WXI5_ENSVE|nr:hypothetical protein B296_00051293 [Ensete ventricosum]